MLTTGSHFYLVCNIGIWGFCPSLPYCGLKSVTDTVGINRWHVKYEEPYTYSTRAGCSKMLVLEDMMVVNARIDYCAPYLFNIAQCLGVESD
jgi:hypothetical protein